MNTELILIAAVGNNLEIGKDNKLVWRNREDLQRFKKLTLYRPVIMGRATFESLKIPLPKRTNIVISKHNEIPSKGGIIYHAFNIEEALSIASFFGSKAYIIGGENVYKQTINLSDKLELTEVHQEFEADAFFPEYKNRQWRETSRMKRADFDFVTYVRNI